MYIKYFFDLKKGDYIVYDKQYGTLIQIYENKISYEQLMTMLQLSNVDVTKIISVKAFSLSLSVNEERLTSFKAYISLSIFLRTLNTLLNAPVPI